MCFIISLLLFPLFKNKLKHLIWTLLFVAVEYVHTVCGSHEQSGVTGALLFMAAMRPCGLWKPCAEWDHVVDGSYVQSGTMWFMEAMCRVGPCGLWKPCAELDHVVYGSHVQSWTMWFMEAMCRVGPCQAFRNCSSLCGTFGLVDWCILQSWTECCIWTD